MGINRAHLYLDIVESCVHKGIEYSEVTLVYQLLTCTFLDDGGFIPTSNPCEEIRCLHGQVKSVLADCVEDLAPHLWVCANPVKKPGWCCSSCPSGGKPLKLLFYLSKGKLKMQISSSVECLLYNCSAHITKQLYI